jgi:hypothetical protein
MLSHENIIFVILPLMIAFVTHLWNPLGFPGIHYDEGIYMRRTMHVLDGLGPQDPLNQFDHTQETTSGYDHPFFGQLFLGSVLSIVDYPDSFVSEDALESIQNLYTIPRIVMGILAVIDTFLVYKIADVRYNRNMAFVASILFAAMPLTWLLSRIVLDSLLLPFLLLSILFAVYCNKLQSKKKDITKERNITLLALVSGTFLGIAVLTKLPALSMIPLITFILIYGNFRFDRDKNLRLLGKWFIPAILIPIIWPAYSISTGEFDEWLSGVLWQATARQEERGLVFAFSAMWDIDPLLFLLGISGIIFTSIKRDFFFALWLIPYLILVYYVGWVTHFHWIIVFAVFCAAASFLILNLPKIAASHAIHTKIPRQLLIFSLFLITIGFGMASTATMINADISSLQVKTAAFILEQVKTAKRDSSSSNSSIADKDNVTIISSPMYSWLFMYPFKETYVLSWFRDSSQPVHTQKVLLVVDQFYKGWTKRESGEDQKQQQLINDLHNQTRVIREFKAPETTYDKDAYPFTGLGQGRIGASDVEIRTNY